MSSYGLLDQAEEDALHLQRLLNVEERPFKRITKRLTAPDSLIISSPAPLPTPPPDANGADEAAAALVAFQKQRAEALAQFRTDVSLDFAAFESTIVRMQFVRAANEKERGRYAEEKLKIQETAQNVRDNTAELRVQLEEAQKTLALRKTYDEMALKITENKNLKPREEQHANIEKLKEEIAQLEEESREYAKTWAERREQFGKIVEEGMQLRRLIRDEKEEVERREGMEEDEDDGDGTSRDRASNSGTPRADQGGMTPMHSGEPAGSGGGGLMVGKQRAVRALSPLRSSIAVSTPDESKDVTEGEDANMADEGEVTGDDGEIDDKQDSQMDTS